MECYRVTEHMYYVWNLLLTQSFEDYLFEISFTEGSVLKC